MIRITDRFTVRRVDGFLNVAIDGGLTVLNASQAKDAAEAFNVMAVMMEAAEPESEGKEVEVALPAVVDGWMSGEDYISNYYGGD